MHDRQAEMEVGFWRLFISPVSAMCRGPYCLENSNTADEGKTSRKVENFSMAL